MTIINGTTDFVQLPASGTGKKVAAKQITLNSVQMYLPGTELLDAAGNIIDGVTGTPAGTENALVVRDQHAGYSIRRVIAAASTNATSVKASAGHVHGWHIYNAAASVRYLKLYNKASAPTVGSDTPVITIPVAAGGSDRVEFSNGIAFATGIALALTNLLADSDTTALTANDCILTLLYK